MVLPPEVRLPDTFTVCVVGSYPTLTLRNDEAELLLPYTATSAKEFHLLTVLA
ncbi:hypothetical protein D3C73_924160 [compost metagenome]